MRILGIDPGTATLGYGVIEMDGRTPVFVSAGVLETSKNLADAQRLEILAKEMEKLIKKYQPEVLAVEKLFFSKNVKTAMTVSQARGVVLLVGQRAGLRIIESSPQDVKMSVTGYGKADKKQVQKMVQVLLKLKSVPKPDDAADALSAALSVAFGVK